MGKIKSLSPDNNALILETLKHRFEKNRIRHQEMNWDVIEKRLQIMPEKLWTLHEMEKTGGEPDVIEKDNDIYVFYDCAAESPIGRRSLCYDRASLDARKENKPKHNAIEMAAEMGIELLTEQQYRKLQLAGNFDTKTSSWILTPDEIRKLDGALFCDRRYNNVFVYHNGASSYYAARGFRGILRV